MPLALLVVGLGLCVRGKRTPALYDAFVASFAAIVGLCFLQEVKILPFPFGTTTPGGCLGFWSLAILLTGLFRFGPMSGFWPGGHLMLFAARAVIGCFAATGFFFIVLNALSSGIRHAAAWLPLGALSTLVFVIARHHCWQWARRRGVRAAIFLLPVGLALVPGAVATLAWVDAAGLAPGHGPVSPWLCAAVSLCLNALLFVAFTPKPPILPACRGGGPGETAGGSGLRAKTDTTGSAEAGGGGPGAVSKRLAGAGASELLGRYLASPWAPAAVYAVILTAFVASSLPRGRPFTYVSNALLLFLVVSFLAMLLAGLWAIFKRRWEQCLVRLALLLGCVALTCLAMPLLLLARMAGPSEDGFADGLCVPPGVEAAEPREPAPSGPGGPEDVFQQRVLAALAGPGGADPGVTAHLPMFSAIQGKAPEVLRRFLATSPAWRVFRENGQVFATRRWMIGAEWRYTLHGYYTDSEFHTWPDADVPRFQCRFTIGLSGKPWAGYRGDATRVAPDGPTPLRISTGNEMFQSRCVVAAGRMPVEVFEQSRARERRITKAALAHLEAELAPLVAEPTWATIRAGLPPGGIRKGERSFDLIGSFQPGIYETAIWINPGEPGMIYLKAFEVSRGTALSGGRLKECSNEWVGWSDDPAEQFYSNANFTIYEGDWGKPYAARFEVWFTPDSGGPDRKLAERVFRIEGWQR